MAFDFRKSLIKVQGNRQYLPVSARLVWFREEHPDWGIVTEAVEVSHEKQYAVFRATVFDAGGRVMATGTKMEDVRGFGDWLEKAETGSVGRALALCGFGTQFAPDLDDGGEEESTSAATGGATPRSGAKSTGEMACAGCGSGITEGQNTVSVRKFGEPLCPACQRDKPAPGGQADAR